MTPGTETHRETTTGSKSNPERDHNMVDMWKRRWSQQANLLVELDVFVSHPREQLSEVLSLVALPAFPVCLQVSVETLQAVLAFLHLNRNLQGDTQH